MGTSDSGPLITDEQVLEKLFRGGYTRWVDDAKKRLGPEAAAAAPRVVSKAFHLAWTDRKRLHSQDELDAFLGANIQHGSARELSRRASAARMAHGAHKEAHDHEMNVDEAWDRLKQTLSGGSPEAYRKRASTARHEAAEHMAALGRRKFNWKPVAAIGGFAVVVVVSVIWYLGLEGADRAVLQALGASDVRHYETTYGQQVRVTLDDSTVALVGPESRLTVPGMFGIELRAVRVVGTVNFEVTQEQSQPFDVRTGSAALTAGPGNFTVTRFAEATSAIVHAHRGTVNVRLGEATRTIADGAALQLDDAGTMVTPAAGALSEATSWVGGTVNIQGRSLRDALPLMKRWFALDIRVPEAELLERQVFISSPMTSRNTAISQVEQSGSLKFGYVGENMTFKDAPSTKTKAPARRP